MKVKDASMKVKDAVKALSEMNQDALFVVNDTKDGQYHEVISVCEYFESNIPYVTTSTKKQINEAFAKVEKTNLDVKTIYVLE